MTGRSCLFWGTTSGHRSGDCLSLFTMEIDFNLSQKVDWSEIAFASLQWSTIISDPILKILRAIL